MIKNITIGVLGAVVVGLLVYIGVMKKPEAKMVPPTEQQNVGISPEVSKENTAVKGMTLLAESPDKTYSVFASYEVADRNTKLPEALRVSELDRSSKGDTVYLKNNISGETTIVFTDTNSRYESVTTARFLNNSSFVFINNVLFKFDIPSKKLSTMTPSNGEAWLIKAASPKGETLVLGIAESQETGHDVIVDLKTMKELWIAPTWGGPNGYDISKYKTENTLFYYVSYEDPQTGNQIDKDYVIDLQGNKL